MLEEKALRLRTRARVAGLTIALALGLLLLGTQVALAEEKPSPAAPAIAQPLLTGPHSQAPATHLDSPVGIAQVNPGYTADLTHNAVWGLVNPGDTVTVTRTAADAFGSAEADGSGFFWTYLWFPDGRPADLAPGDTLQVNVNGSLAATLVPLDISGGVDVLADDVTGTILGLTPGTVVTATLGDFGGLPATEPWFTDTVDTLGNYAVDFTGIADVGPHMLAQVQYRDPVGGYTVLAYVYPSDVFRVFGWHSVEGYAEPLSTVTVTVYVTTTGTVRWSDVAYAIWPHGRYSANGDIGYGDRVEVDLGGGTVVDVVADYLEVRPDATTDQIAGVAPAGETVRGQVWDPFADLYDDAQAVADGNGDYTIALGLDLQTSHWPYVAYADAEGDEVGYAAPPPHIRAYPPWNGLYAVADAPNQPVTYTLDTGSETTTHYGSCDQTNACDWIDVTTLEPGYVITAEFATWETAMVVADVSLAADTAGDGVSGTADIGGQVDVTICQWNSDGYPTHGCGLSTTVAASPFAVTFPGFDVRDGMILFAYHYDDTDGHRTIANRGDWETSFIEVNPPYGIGGSPSEFNEHVTAYLYDTDGSTLLASTDNDFDDNPWRFWFGNFGGYTIEPGYWVTVTADSGWSASLQVPTLTVEADADTDLIWGEGPKAQVLVEHGWDGGWFGVWLPVDGYAWDRGYGGADLQFGDTVRTTYVAPNGNRVRVDYWWPHARLNVNYPHDWASVETVPGATVALTVAGKASVSGQANPNGWFNSDEWPWDPERPNIEPGDAVTATAVGLTATVDPVGTIEGVVDADAETVSGVVYAPFPTVTVACEVWTWGGPQIVITDVNGSGGSYFCDFGAIGWDVEPGQEIAVRYYEPDGDSVINVFSAPWMRVNYGDDWVGATYPAGHTFWLTVTDELGAPKGYAEIDAVPGGGWGGDGFETRDEDWQGLRPNIVPGDWVYARSDDGYTHALEVGEITGALDVGQNTVQGTITAGFTENLQVRCEVWVENGPDGIELMVDPDGGAYLCDFDDVGWDLLPGQTVSVRYYEPDDNDAIINTFREPAPDVRVEKWAEGSGQAAPGGPVVYTLRYRNEGNAEAATVYLTDTLPANTTYVSDTSGFAASVGGGQVVWTFGPVAPNDGAQFQLVLTNSASAGDVLLNQADVWALYDDNPWNNHAEAEAYVTEGQESLYVGKHPEPGDPAQGQTMVWQIGYGNDGPVASGPVLLTDTLPENTSLVSWYSQNGYDLWTDHSTADQLILEAPSLPANWGDQIYLRLQVNAAPGTQLTNTVEISSAHSYAWEMRDDVWVGDPYENASLDKNLDWGVLVPGGYVVYHLHVRNNGNVATQTWATDTFPAGTSFEDAWIWTGTGEQPFPPTSYDDTMAVWDLGVMEPAAWYDIGLRLAISDTVAPGTVFTNCAEVAIDGDDGWPSDDAECVSDRLQDAGPNLRVDKDYQWDGEGQIHYDLYIRNFGTERLAPVWITDAYPADVTFNDDWWVSHGPWITLTHDAPNGELVFWLEQFEPGESARVNYRLDLDHPGVEGVCFLNDVQAPITDDVWPDDNEDAVSACTGPDVYVEKWLSGGQPKPGEIVTFTVEFGNRNRSPWNTDEGYGSHITDTLPAEMTFITATAPWDPDEPWHPEFQDGQTVVWGWGPMWAENWWRFELVAQITGDVEDGDVLVNTVEAYGDSPEEVEPDYANNAFDLPLTVLAPVFDVGKAYETEGLTGGVVTYTLTVTNNGSAEATNVVLRDTLPAGLTYGGGDGAFDGSEVTWTLASIPAGGGTATAWFWATLPDEEGTILNDAYRVASSDQGVDSPNGPPVSFEVTRAKRYIYLPIVIKND